MVNLPVIDYLVIVQVFTQCECLTGKGRGIRQREGIGIAGGRANFNADVAKSVYRPDLYLEAAKLLVADGKAKKEDFPWTSDGFRAPTSEAIDGVTYDGRKPNDYLNSLAIGLKGDQHVSGSKVVAN